MENNQGNDGLPQEKPTNMFEVLGVQAPPSNPNPDANPDNDGGSNANPNLTPDAGAGNAGDGSGGAGDEPTFKASDLKVIFGEFESIESVKERYEALNAKASKYDEFEPLINDQETLFKELESPFADETLASINSFMKHTGVKDRSVAEKFVGKTADEIKQSPIQTMALAQVLENPALLKDISFEDLCEAIAEDNNTYADVTFDDAPKTMKMKIGKSVSTVEEKLQNISENKDILSSLRNKYNESKETITKVVNEWKPVVGDLTKQSEYEFEIEGLKVKAQVSEQTKAQLEKEVLSLVKSNPSLPNDQNVELMSNYIRSRVESLEARNIYKQLITAAKGEAREQAIKEFNNGSEVRRTEKPGGGKEKSQLEAWFDRQV